MAESRCRAGTEIINAIRADPPLLSAVEILPFKWDSNRIGHVTRCDIVFEDTWPLRVRVVHQTRSYLNLLLTAVVPSQYNATSTKCKTLRKIVSCSWSRRSWDSQGRWRLSRRRIAKTIDGQRTRMRQSAFFFYPTYLKRFYNFTDWLFLFLY